VSGHSNRVPIRSIKAWWLFAAFLSGMGLAMVAEDLILHHRNNRLEFSAPNTNIITGQPLARLKNAAEVPFLIKTTLWSGTKTHVFTSAADQFIVSFDIWEKTDKAYSVVKVAAPRKMASHLTAKALRDWCLSQMSLDTTGLSGSEPLWARLEIRAEDPLRDGSWLGDSVNSSGISPATLIATLIEIFGRPAGSQPHWTLDYPQFTLDSLKSTRGS
jgi:hypothetical protein